LVVQVGITETERMPSLICGNTEQDASKPKICKGKSKPTSEPGPNPNFDKRRNRLILSLKLRFPMHTPITRAIVRYSHRINPKMVYLAS